MNKILISLIAALISVSAFSQLQKGRIDSSLLPQIGAHYQEEYNFDVSTNEQAWLSQPSGLQVSFGSTDELYFRKEVPVTSKVTEKQMTAWKGERINIQQYTSEPPDTYSR